MCTSRQLTPSIAFTALGLIDKLKDALRSLPLMVNYLWEAWTSCAQLDEFLSQAEVMDNIQWGDEIKFDHAELSWPFKGGIPSNGFLMKDINLQFLKNELSIICGNTGSGKSLLLASVIGEVNMRSGQILAPRMSSTIQLRPNDLNQNDWTRNSSIAFVSQPPWIEDTSIKENILFS